MALHNEISGEFKEAAENRKLNCQACAAEQSQMQQGGTSHSNDQVPLYLHFVWRGQKVPN